jgi:hypothetical protein
MAKPGAPNARHQIGNHTAIVTAFGRTILPNDALAAAQPAAGVTHAHFGKGFEVQ